MHFKWSFFHSRYLNKSNLICRDTSWSTVQHILFSVIRFSLTVENHDHALNNQTKPADEIGEVTVLTHDELQKQKKLDQKRRHGIVLWRCPITTLTYFCFEMGILLSDYKAR